MSMIDQDKNIRLTVVRPETDNNEITIDLFDIFSGMKRFFALWLTLAIAAGALAVGVGIASRKVVYSNDASSLIEYTANNESVDTTNLQMPAVIDANDESIDITKLQMPAVIEEAINNVGLELRMVDDIRDNLTITAVMSDEAYNQQTLYYNLLTKSNANMETVRSVLNSSDQPTRYIISLNYHKAKLTREEGVRLLDEIVKSYQRYFEETYNSNAMLGNSLNVIDYTEYDFPEALNMFRESLDSIDTYLNEAILRNMDSFRSDETGYTVSDLLSIAEVLRNVELSRISSFIDVNSVTAKDPSVAIAHYQLLIENVQRNNAVLESRLSSLQSAVESYQRDPIVYSTDSNGQIVKGTDQEDAYDGLIQSQIDTQNQISANRTTIRYYENVIEKLQKSERVLESNIEKANTYMASFNEKLNALVNDINTTVSEYYSKAIRANTLQILVPANAKAPGITEGKWIKTLLIIEVVLLLGYLGMSFVSAINKGNPRKEKTAAV